MAHETALLATLAAGFGLAFVLGLLAARLRLPPLVGYLLAGVALGPFTPGFVGDAGVAAQLAEVGVILLMFGVGLHFSVSDLAAVRGVAVPGAAVQILLATALGACVARFWGWSWTSGVVFGLCLSVASTVVLLRALEGRGVLDTRAGRLAVGWLIVEDLVTVLILVLLPLFASLLEGRASGARFALEAALTLGKVAVFIAVMHVVGRRVLPWLLGRVARTGSRELFTLGVLAIALGVAVGAASLFGVSLALGAFFAGVVLSESDWSHRAASESLPLQDAFAVLFFVSVGMLFDPRILLNHPLHVLLVVLIVVVGKSVASIAIALAFRLPAPAVLTVAAGLSQIGEFSFILVELAIALRLLDAESRGLVLAGALVSITVNPLLFGAIDPALRFLRSRPRLAAAFERRARVDPVPLDAALAPGHVVIVGYGRVGGTIGAALQLCGIPFVVVEQDRAIFETLRRDGIPAIYGDAARPGILEHAEVATAAVLVVATPEFFQAREVLAHARRLNPAVRTVTRTHSAAARRELERLGGGLGRAFMGERELALGMAHYALQSLGRTDHESAGAIEALRAAEAIEAPGPL